MQRKAMLASNYNEEKLVFPLGAQPKIDGVRGLNMDGNLTGRSLKSFKNKYSTDFFSIPDFIGLDGEFGAHKETHPRLCSLTTSALSTIEGSPWLMWHVFDYVTEETKDLPYKERYSLLNEHVIKMRALQTFGRVSSPWNHIEVVPMFICDNMDKLSELDSLWLSLGYEGTIIRNLNAPHKAGRSTVREGGLLRIKRFVEEEAIVIKINEGEQNNNEAQINELGRQFRSSHQENKTANGQVGSLECIILKDSELFKAGQQITVSKGTMTEEEAIDYFRNPHKILNQTIKFKHFPKGVKDKPRFPIFQSIRVLEDM